MRVNTRFALLKIGRHLGMNNLRMYCKQGFWEKRFNGLVITPQTTLCKSQYHHHEHGNTKESKLRPDITFDGHYEPNYGSNDEDSREREARLQRSEQERT